MAGTPRADAKTPDPVVPADVTHHDAGPENVARVAAKLAAAGWPLAGMDLLPDAGPGTDGR